MAYWYAPQVNTASMSPRAGAGRRTSFISVSVSQERPDMRTGSSGPSFMRLASAASYTDWYSAGRGLSARPPSMDTYLRMPGTTLTVPTP